MLRPPLASGDGSGRSDTTGAPRPGGLPAAAGTCPRALDAALNRSLHPTQRRLALALVVTVVCLPLLVLDQLGSHGGGAPEVAVVDTAAPEPSMVVAVSPSLDATTTTTAAPATTVAPSTTVAPTATTTPAATPKRAPSTTTTTSPPVTAAPKAKAKAAPAPTTTAPPAPAPPVATGATPTAWESSFLACVRHRESRGVYGAVDPTGRFMGAYQIYQGGWDAVAASIGRPDLVGVRPNTASPADQDAVALAMLRAYGTGPWGGSCG